MTRAAATQLKIRNSWIVDSLTGKSKRPIHLNVPQPSTIAQLKMQAVQQGKMFRRIVTDIGVATKLDITLPKAIVSADTGLLTKVKEAVSDNDPPEYRASLYDENDDTTPTIQQQVYSSKEGYRMAQKQWVRQDASTICDVNRALLEADDFGSMLAAATHIFSRDDIEIVDVKVRLYDGTEGFVIYHCTAQTVSLFTNRIF